MYNAGALAFVFKLNVNHRIPALSHFLCIERSTFCVPTLVEMQLQQHRRLCLLHICWRTQTCVCIPWIIRRCRCSRGRGRGKWCKKSWLRQRTRERGSVSRINDRGCSWEWGQLRSVPDMMNPITLSLLAPTCTQKWKTCHRNYPHGSQTKFAVLFHPVVTASSSGCGV